MKITKFEDLECWQQARKLVNIIYDLTNNALFKKDFGLKQQIQRASVSCVSNIAEGFSGGSAQQFIQYLTYTRRSTSEVQSQLYVALDRKYITRTEFDKVYEQAKSVAKLANGFIKYLKSKPTNRLTKQPTNQTTD